MQKTHAQLIEAESLLSDSDILENTLDQEQKMDEAVEDCFEGLVSPIIVKGPPGIGKTEGIKIKSRQFGVTSTDSIASKWVKPEDGPAYPYELDGPLKQVDGALIRGADYEPWALTSDLYFNKDKGAIVIDDNDDILKDMTAVAMLMAATEQTATRPVSYPKAASTHELQLRGVESSFEVNTPLIILTNIDMGLHVKYAQDQQNKTGKPMRGYFKRWAALMSRGRYIDIQLNTPRSVRTYCEYKINQINMLTDSGYLEEKFGRSLTADESRECMKWVRYSQGSLQLPLSLRTYNHVAGIMIKRKDTWERSAKANMLQLV
jgi:hypothetical protein